MLPQKKTRFPFIIDTLGALVSAAMLGLVLPHFVALTGIPFAVLKLLVIPPLLYVLIDFCAIVQLHHKWSAQLLRFVAVLNLLYCLFSISIAFIHTSSLTLFGWMYILGEIGIILVLARWEWKTAKRIASR